LKQLPVFTTADKRHFYNRKKYINHEIVKIMQLKLLFQNWTRIAATLLLAGALAWTAKLSVIIATNGKVITSGAAALFMQIGIVLLLIGSTGFGTWLAAKRQTFLRILAIVLSPAFLVASVYLLSSFVVPLFQNSAVWYAQQEVPIALAVIVSGTLGIFLHKRNRLAVSTSK
jgi:hypothetical protein